MSTIETYQEDASAMGRINSWKFALAVASARPTGGGLNVWTPEAFETWAPEGAVPLVAHSIYFSVLGEHGWFGLILFIWIYWLTWRYAKWVIHFSKDKEEHQWARQLAAMIQVSLIAYLVGGAFLSLSYFDLPWHLVAITVVLRAYLESQDSVKQKESIEPEASTGIRADEAELRV